MAKKQHTYEEMLSEVEAIIAELQSEDFALDRVVSMVKRGHALLAELKNKLDAISVQIIEIRDGGTLAAEQD